MIPVQNSIELVMWIESHLQNLSLAQLDRTRVAAACFAVALEHHHAIVILLREARIASAFALVRSQFEAYVRGVWFVECATDVQLNSFLSDKSRPKIEQLLCAIEEQPAFDSKELSGIKATNWKSMCSYIHTGWHQVSRWITMHGLAINVNYDLSGFEQIVPCGIKDRSVANLLEFLPGVSLAEVQEKSIEVFCQVFMLKYNNKTDQ